MSETAIRPQEATDAAFAEIARNEFIGSTAEQPGMASITLGMLSGDRRQFDPGITVTPDQVTGLLDRMTEENLDSSAIDELSDKRRQEASTDPQEWHNWINNYIDTGRNGEQSEDLNAVLTSLGVSDSQSFYDTYFANGTDSNAIRNAIINGCRNPDGAVDIMKFQRHFAAIRPMLGSVGDEALVGLMGDVTRLHVVITQDEPARRDFLTRVSAGVGITSPEGAMRDLLIEMSGPSSVQVAAAETTEEPEPPVVTPTNGDSGTSETQPQPSPSDISEPRTPPSSEPDETPVAPATEPEPTPSTPAHGEEAAEASLDSEVQAMNARLQALESEDIQQGDTSRKNAYLDELCAIAKEQQRLGIDPTPTFVLARKSIGTGDDYTTIPELDFDTDPAVPHAVANLERAKKLVKSEIEMHAWDTAMEDIQHSFNIRIEYGFGTTITDYVKDFCDVAGVQGEANEVTTEALKRAKSFVKTKSGEGDNKGMRVLRSNPQNIARVIAIYDTYLKIGQTEEADKIAQRVRRDFPEGDKLVALAKRGDYNLSVPDAFKTPSVQEEKDTATGESTPTEESPAPSPTEVEGKDDNEEGREAPSLPIQRDGKFFDPANSDRELTKDESDRMYSAAYWYENRETIPYGLRDQMISNIRSAGEPGGNGQIGTFVDPEGITEKDRMKMSAYKVLAEELGYEVGEYTHHQKTHNVNAPISK
ncbi:MAG: hypothetical protein AAB553_02210 [Patescibacteria group bacterium]